MKTSKKAHLGFNVVEDRDEFEKVQKQVEKLQTTLDELFEAFFPFRMSGSFSSIITTISVHLIITDSSIVLPM